MGILGVLTIYGVIVTGNALFLYPGISNGLRGLGAITVCVTFMLMVLAICAHYEDNVPFIGSKLPITVLLGLQGLTVYLLWPNLWVIIPFVIINLIIWSGRAND